MVRKAIGRGKTVKAKDPNPGADDRTFFSNDELDAAAENKSWVVRKKQILNPVRAIRTAAKRKIGEIRKLKDKMR